MKKFIAFLLGVALLTNCNQPAEEVKKFQPGERQGADTSMVNLSGSINITDLVVQHWDNAEDLEDVKQASDKLQMPCRGFYLFKDGSMVKNPRDDMSFGNWSWDEKNKGLVISLQNGTKEEYSIRSVSYDEMLMGRKGGQGPSVKYIADGFVHRNLEDDPFYPANMQWRVKPGASEDDAAIRRRVKACLHFYSLFYADNSKRNALSISFYGLPGCFNWYAGGINLKKEEKLGRSWTDIFYNAADASKAYTLLDRMISKKYTWDEGEKSWVKQNGGVLKQMEDRIDSL